MPYQDIDPPPLKLKKVHQDSPYMAILVESDERGGRGGADPRERFSNIDRDDDYHSSCGPSNSLPRGGRRHGTRMRRIGPGHYGIAVSLWSYLPADKGREGRGGRRKSEAGTG